jgi:antitoxin (DNA-binding transcriptional repressor) of toxin-antitoxin stability system
MKTIGAKELRLHLDQVLDRVIKGEDIIISHRFKAPVRLSALHMPYSNRREELAGLRAFDAAPKRNSPYDPNKPIKDLYHESISKKYIG